MKIVLASYLNRERDKSSEWKLFTSNGDLAPLPSLETLAWREDVILRLQSGSYWLLQIDQTGVQVRSIVIKDEYPVSAKETLITDLVSDFLLEGKEPDQVEELLRDRSGYPEQLIDMIVARLKEYA